MHEWMRSHLCTRLRGESWLAEETALPFNAESRLPFCLRGPSLPHLALQPPILHSIADHVTVQPVRVACMSD